MHVYQRGYWRILQQYSAVSCHCAIANTVKFKPVQIYLYYYPPLPALYLWSRYLLVFMILLISLTTSVSIYLWNMNNDNNVINNSQPYFVWEFHIHVKKHEVVTSPNPTLTSDPEHARWDTFPLLHKLIFFLPRPTILSPSLPIPFTSILWGQIGATLKPCQEKKRSKIPLC